MEAFTTALAPEHCVRLSDSLTSAPIRTLFDNGTRWFPSDAEPQNALQRAVSQIFHHHTHRLRWSYNAASSGAEYWVGVRSELNSGGFPSEGIHLHRDFDLMAEETTGRADILPNLSTVTFLSTARSMPTIVLSNFSQGATIGRSSVYALWLSYPSCGKHIAFGGNLWHGVPPPARFLRRDSSIEGENLGRHGTQRVTLLVNIWLDRQPLGVAEHEVARASSERASSAQGLAFPPSLGLQSVPDDQTETWQESHSTSNEILWHTDNFSKVSGRPERSLALILDKQTCDGVHVALPEQLTSGDQGRPASQVVYDKAGRTLQYTKAICKLAGEPHLLESGPSDDANEAFSQAAVLRSKDPAASMDMLLRAASWGHADAQAVVGQAYAQGLGGLPVDMNASMRWLRLAAMRGNQDAQYNLVAICEARVPCLEAPTAVQAQQWLDHAASEGFQLMYGQQETHNVPASCA